MSYWKDSEDNIIETYDYEYDDENGTKIETITYANGKIEENIYKDEMLISTKIIKKADEE